MTVSAGWHGGVVPLTTEFSGSVLVTSAGEVVVRASAGEADASEGNACTAETRFQIASVSKQLTAAAVMLLDDDGSLDLGDPIGHLLLGCAPPWREPILHQLLSHTSGRGHWRAPPRLRRHPAQGTG